MSQVVYSAHLHLLDPLPMQLLSQWMLHLWWVSGHTVHETFSCTPPSMSSTRLDRPQVAYFNYLVSLPGIKPTLPALVVRTHQLYHLAS